MINPRLYMALIGKLLKCYVVWRLMGIWDGVYFVVEQFIGGIIILCVMILIVLSNMLMLTAGGVIYLGDRGYKMKVGTIVKLKVACLGNVDGTKGVVFYNYGDGFQAIFKNGSYDGFSLQSKMVDGMIEADYFLEEIGFDEKLSNYQFKNVIQVSNDFRSGVFDIIK